MKKKLLFMYLFDEIYVGIKEDDKKRVDVVNYSFGLIVDGKVNVDHLKHLDEVVALKKDGIKVTLSVGGWGADGFSDAVETKETREVFIKSIMDLIKKYDLDGIDLDWEFPTQATSAKTKTRGAIDREHYSYLIKELREELDNYKKGLLLTAAVVCADDKANEYYDCKEITKYFDYLHIMSYAFRDPSCALHLASLYKSNFTQADGDHGVQDFINAGFDKDKIVLGACYYGFLYKVVDKGPIGTNIGAKVQKDENGDYIRAKEIKHRFMHEYLDNPEYIKVKDEDAQADYMYKDDEVIAYESVDSLIEKCKYVKKHNLAGMLVWEYTKDSDDCELTRTIAENLNK